MVTTYSFDNAGGIVRSDPQEAPWPVKDPCSPTGWSYPNATHTGSAETPGDPILITYILAVYDGAVDHVAWAGKGHYSYQVHRAATELCARAKGARVEGLLKELDGQVGALRNNESADRLSASELVRAALRAALSNRISDDSAL